MFAALISSPASSLADIELSIIIVYELREMSWLSSEPALPSDLALSSSIVCMTSVLLTFIKHGLVMYFSLINDHKAFSIELDQQQKTRAPE